MKTMVPRSRDRARMIWPVLSASSGNPTATLSSHCKQLLPLHPEEEIMSDFERASESTDVCASFHVDAAAFSTMPISAYEEEPTIVQTPTSVPAIERTSTKAPSDANVRRPVEGQRAVDSEVILWPPEPVDIGGDSASDPQQDANAEAAVTPQSRAINAPSLTPAAGPRIAATPQEESTEGPFSAEPSHDTAEVAAAPQDAEQATSELQPENTCESKAGEPDLGASVGSSAETSPPAAPAVKPAWEVDRLRWPEVCERLLAEESDYFQHAGQKLSDASKQGLKILAVTASKPAEGCSTLAVCLTRAVASSGARVALIDANRSNAQLSLDLGLELPAAWMEIVAGAAPWTEAAIAATEPSITVIPGTPTQSEQPQQENLAARTVLQEISAHYDLLILDLGPLSAESAYLWAPDAPSIVDAAIVVRDCRQTTEADTVAVVAKLKSMGVQAVGVAENYAASLRSAAAA